MGYTHGETGLCHNCGRVPEQKFVGETMKSRHICERMERRSSVGFVATVGTVNNRRSGLMMTELIVSMVLLAICMSALAPGVGWSLKQQKLGLQRQIARLELVNQLELLSALPWEELTAERLNQLSIAPETALQLPSAVLSGELSNVSDPIESRAVRLTLGWKMFNGVEVRPVELCTVIHRREKS